MGKMGKGNNVALWGSTRGDCPRRIEWRVTWVGVFLSFWFSLYIFCRVKIFTLKGILNEQWVAVSHILLCCTR